MKKMIAVLLCALCIAAVADNKPKIGVVNLEMIFRDYYKTKIVEANLQRQADLYSNYAKTLQESLKKLNEEFTMLRDESLSMALTDATRESRRRSAADKYRMIEQKKAELQNYSREKSAQLRDERDRERAKIFKDIQAMVAKQAQIRGLALVLDKSSGIGSYSTVIYNTQEIDITESVLKQLNAGHSSK